MPSPWSSTFLRPTHLRSHFNTLTDLGLIGARLGHAVLWLSRLMPENLQIDCIREKEARWRNNQAAAPQSLKVRDRGRPQHQRALPCTPQGSPSCTGPRHARWGARALPCPAVPYLAHPPPVHHPRRRPDPSRPASGRRPSQRRPAPLGAALASAVRGRTCLPTPTLLCLLSSTAQHTTSAWHQDPRHPDPGLMRTRPLPPPG